MAGPRLCTPVQKSKASSPTSSIQPCDFNRPAWPPRSRVERQQRSSFYEGQVTSHGLLKGCRSSDSYSNCQGNLHYCCGTKMPGENTKGNSRAAIHEQTESKIAGRGRLHMAGSSLLLNSGSRINSPRARTSQATIGKGRGLTGKQLIRGKAFKKDCEKAAHSSRKKCSSTVNSRSSKSKLADARCMKGSAADGARHSPRLFSMFTLEEYLREKSCLPLGEDLEASSRLSSFDSPALPLLSADLHRHRPRTLRRPRPTSKLRPQIVSNSCCFPAALPIAAPTLQSEEDSSSYMHGCVAWPSMAAKLRKYKKKRTAMDYGAKSFAGGFPVSKRSSRRRNYSTRRQKCMGYTPTLSDPESETAVLLSKSELCVQDERCTTSDDADDYNDDKLANSDVRRPAPVELGREESLQVRNHVGTRDSQFATTDHPRFMQMKVGRIETYRDKGQIANKSSHIMEPDISQRRSFHKKPLKQKNVHCRDEKRRPLKHQTMHRSLSQKYRPKNFREMVGQNMVAQALTNAVLRGRVAPLYLFQGPRGTGKTSAARIFAAAMNCTSMVGEERPCLRCYQCEELAKGRSSDIKEVDAHGIHSMRSLLAHAAMPPHAPSKYKVVIIDDCHMLSQEAWSSFLKAMEDPPRHSVFVLITSDQDQLPRTVVSRCQRFPFPKLRDAAILDRLQKLVQAERVDIEREALELITARCDGSLRDAETTLDQLSILGQKITAPMVRELVGLIPDDKLVELLQLALSADTVSTVRCVRELIESGIEPLALMSQLATLITDMLAGNMSTKNTCKGCVFSGHQLSKEELERLRKALKILSEAEKQLRACNDRTTWLTAALLQFSPVETNAPEYTFNSYNQQFQYHFSSMGTSVTQSPIAFLDTSEETTTELHPPASSTSLVIKPPWEREKLLSEDDVLFTFEKSENRPANKSVVQSSNISPHVRMSEACLGAAGRELLLPKPEQHSDVKDFVSKLSPSPADDLNQEAVKKMSPCSMVEVWRKVMMEGSRSDVLRQLLLGHGKLLSLSVSGACATAHLEFRSAEDKSRAEAAKSAICTAFQTAMGCPVDIKISLAVYNHSSQAAHTAAEIEQRRTLIRQRSPQAGAAEAPGGDRSSERKSSTSLSKATRKRKKKKKTTEAKTTGQVRHEDQLAISCSTARNMASSSASLLLSSSSSIRDDSWRHCWRKGRDHVTSSRSSSDSRRLSNNDHNNNNNKWHADGTSRKTQVQKANICSDAIICQEEEERAGGADDDHCSLDIISTHTYDHNSSGHVASLSVEGDSCQMHDDDDDDDDDASSYEERHHKNSTFKTGHLCWKRPQGTSRTKVWQHKPRRRRKVTSLMRFIPCATCAGSRRL